MPGDGETSSAVYEYRVYETLPGKMAALQKRFAEATIPIWRAHGISPLGFWVPITGKSNELHYMLRWDDLRHRQTAWELFQRDPAWANAKAESERSGPLVAHGTNQLWSPASFSPLEELFVKARGSTEADGRP